MARQFFTWRSAILKSKLTSNQKWTLVCISTYMNEHGDGAFPSQETLAGDTSLSVRSIQRALKAVTELGWIRVEKHGYAGQQWRRNQYSMGTPFLGQKGDDTVSGPFSEGDDIDDVKVATQCRSITPVNSPSSKILKPSKIQPWKMMNDQLVAECIRYSIATHGKTRQELVEKLKARRSHDGY